MSNARTAAIIEDFVCNGISYRELSIKYTLHPTSIKAIVNKYFDKPDRNMNFQSKLNDNLSIDTYIQQNYNVLNLDVLAGNIGYSKRHVQTIASRLGIIKKIKHVKAITAAKRSKAVRDNLTGREWNSILECANSLGLSVDSVSRYLRGQRVNEKYKLVFIDKKKPVIV